MLEMYIHRTVEGNVRLEEITAIETGCWINLVSPTEDELRKVAREANVPLDFLRYPLDEEERPRIDYEDDVNTVLVIADFPYFDQIDAEMKYVTLPFGILMNDLCIITVSLRKASSLELLKSGHLRDFRTQYHTRFCLQILLYGAQEYLKMLRYIDKLIDEAEQQLARSVSNKDLFALMQLGKSLIYFTTSLKSNQSVVERLLRSRVIKKYEDDEDLLEDVLIEYSQALEMSNIYASIINGTMDAYASIISNNLNVVMKFMAAMTIVLTVPPLITGFFGMNVPFPHDGAAFAANPMPFILLLLVNIGSVVLVAWWLKRKQMF